MEYICIANGPEQGIHPVNSKKKRNDFLTRNVGFRIKSFGRRMEAELWYKQNTIIKKPPEQKEKENNEEEKMPLNKNTIIVLNQIPKKIEGYIAVKKKTNGKRGVFPYHSEAERKDLIQKHNNWSYRDLKASEKEIALEWAGCTKLNEYEKISPEQPAAKSKPVEKAKEPEIVPKKSENEKMNTSVKDQYIDEKDDFWFNEDIPLNKKESVSIDLNSKNADLNLIELYEREQEGILKKASTGELNVPAVQIGTDCRKYLQWYYLEGGNTESFAFFNAHVHTKRESDVMLTNVLVAFKDETGETVYGKENHIWIPDCPANIRIKINEGDNISFKANVYAYKRNDKTVDYSLKNLSDITKIATYFVPTEQCLQKIHAGRMPLPKEQTAVNDLFIQELKTEMSKKLENIENTIKVIGIFHKDKPVLKILRPKLAGFQEENTSYHFLYKCPECNIDLLSHYKYCPKCGNELSWDGLSLTTKK